MEGMEQLVEGQRYDVKVADAQQQIVASGQSDWIARAKSAYAAAVNTAADVIAHYHAAAQEILGAQKARELIGQKQLSQQEIGQLMGIGQPAVSKLLAWERKYGAQLEASDSVPVPSPYYLPPAATPEQIAEKSKKKTGMADVAAEAQRQYQEVQRDYEDRLRALTAELEAKDDRLAELGTQDDDISPVQVTSTSAHDLEEQIVALLSNLPPDEKLDVLARVEARVLAEREAS